MLIVDKAKRAQRTVGDDYKLILAEYKRLGGATAELGSKPGVKEIVLGDGVALAEKEWKAEPKKEVKKVEKKEVKKVEKKVEKKAEKKVEKKTKEKK